MPQSKGDYIRQSARFAPACLAYASVPHRTLQPSAAEEAAGKVPSERSEESLLGLDAGTERFLGENHASEWQKSVFPLPESRCCPHNLGTVETVPCKPAKRLRT